MVGRFHNNVTVFLNEAGLTIVLDRRFHQLNWVTNALTHHHTLSNISPELSRAYTNWGIRAVPGQVPAFLQYDRSRFRAAAHGNLTAVVTLFGEVFLFEPGGELVCGFFTFRQQAAGWMPDGTCWGSEALLGRPETPALGQNRQSLDRGMQANREGHVMKVPFTLRRTAPRPATALLVLSDDVAHLLTICASTRRIASAGDSGGRGRVHCSLPHPPGPPPRSGEGGVAWLPLSASGRGLGGGVDPAPRYRCPTCSSLRTLTSSRPCSPTRPPPS